MSFGNKVICRICNKEKSSLAMKKLSTNIFICDKGLCRKMFNDNIDIINVYGLITVLDTLNYDYKQIILKR